MLRDDIALGVISTIRLNSMRLFPEIQKQTAIFDSSNTLISFPSKYKDILFEAIHSSKMSDCELFPQHGTPFSQVGCEVNDLEDIPHLKVEFGDMKVKVLGKDLIDVCIRKKLQFGGYTCLLKLEVEEGGLHVILGEF